MRLVVFEFTVQGDTLRGVRSSWVTEATRASCASCAAWREEEGREGGWREGERLEGGREGG
eukprot:1193782-Rhodomonas_salina.1